MKLYYYLLTLLVYIDKKFPLFILSKDEILVKKVPTSLHDKKTGWRQWVIIFCCGRPHGADPLPLSTSVHLSLTPSPSVWTS